MPTPPGKHRAPKQLGPSWIDPRAARSLPFSVPGEYFQLVPAGEALMCVARVSHEQAQRDPHATLSRRQLSGLLYENGIPTVRSAALVAYLDSLHMLPKFERRVPGRFSLEPGMSRVSQSAWRGGVGEVAARYSRWFPQQDLNALRYNHPIFDLRTPLGGLNSVKTSVRSGSAAGAPLVTYMRGLEDVLGLRPNAMELARQSLYPQLPRAEAEALILRNGYISVNEDHVEPLRAALRDPNNYRRQPFLRLANQLLGLQPAQVGGSSYRDYTALEQALQRAGNSAAVRQQIEVALHVLREGLASRVQGNGIMTPHLTSLLEFRLAIAAANPHMTPEQIKAWAFPELLLVARHGGGVSGNVKAASIAGGRGAVGGAMVSVIVETGRFIYDEQRDYQRFLNAGVAGGTAGWVGGTTQSLVMSSAGSTLSRSLVMQGASPRLATAAGRGLGGFAAGGLAAPVFSMTSLALDNQEHSGTDYAATGTRAFVAGTLSSALAAGVVGAIWGSEVPVVGNVVGFIIGFAGYYVIDSLTGEQVEQGVRQSLEGPADSNR